MSNCLETERKYLIRKPNFQLLSGLAGYTVSDIEQIYLDEKDGLTRREVYVPQSVISDLLHAVRA